MKKRLHIILIFALLAVIIGIVVFVIFRINNWVNPIKLHNEAKDEDYNSYEDNYDFLLPYINPETSFPEEQEVDTILILGNNPFALDADNENGMATMLEKETGAEVINLAVDNTRVSVMYADKPGMDPLGLFGPFFLSQKLIDPSSNEEAYINAKEHLGDDYPSRADEVIETIQNIDMSKVDLVVYMYDLEDYYLVSPMLNNDDPSDLSTVHGSLVESNRILKDKYPHLRFIYMTSFYSCQETNDNTLIELSGLENDTAANYVYAQIDAGRETQSSVIDNYFGSITSKNYKKYLSDYHTLNNAGKKLLISRLLTAINYKGNNT